MTDTEVDAFTQLLDLSDNDFSTCCWVAPNLIRRLPVSM